jgi:ECF transporter S component (folate family)
MRTKQKVALFGSLRTLVMSSIFVALSIILGKYLAIPVGNIMRFSFESLPVLLAGISFGPLVGMAVGIVADLLGSLHRGYDINLTVTLGAAVIGLVGGLCYRLFRSLPDLFRIILSVVIPHLIGSVVIKTVGLSMHYTTPLPALMLWRLLNYIIVAAMDATALYFLLKSKTMRHHLSIP